MTDTEPTWRKAAAAAGRQDGVEIAHVGGCRFSPTCVHPNHTDPIVLIRDAQNPHQEPLRFNRHEWDEFVAAVKAGEFDR